MKQKIFVVQMLDSQRPNRQSYTHILDSVFYSNDTDAYVRFIPHEEDFEFSSADIVFRNRDDESLVVRPATAEQYEERQSAVYEMPRDLLSHWGRWEAQAVFKLGNEVYSSVIVQFDVRRYLMDERPPKLDEYESVTEFMERNQLILDSLNQDLTNKMTTFTTDEQQRKQAESVREDIFRTYVNKISNKLEIDPRIFGAYWDKSSNSSMTRTDSAVGLVANIGIGSQLVHNDFDSMPIWGEMERVKDDYGNVFVKIPKFYIWKKSGTGFYSVKVSRVRYAGFYLPAIFYDFENDTELDYALIGAYNANLSTGSTKLESKAGRLPHVNNNIVQFRTLAQANGVGYQQMDIHAVDVIQSLFRIEFATLHSQSIHQGYTQGTEAFESGISDDILSSSGAVLNTGLSPFNYRGIENPWGNVYQFIDGININGHQSWITKDARDYASNVFANPYVPIGYLNYDVENGYPTEMGYDSDYPFAEIPIKLGGNSATYYADHYYQSAGQRIALFGGTWSHGSAAGLSSWRLLASSGAASANLGGRLIRKPL